MRHAPASEPTVVQFLPTVPAVIVLLVTLTLLAVSSTPAVGGGIAILGTELTDKGDGDGFADTRETVDLYLTV
jgi:hypothetical protein